MFFVVEACYTWAACCLSVLHACVSVFSEVGRLEPKTEVQIQMYLYCKLEVLPPIVHKSIFLPALGATVVL